MTDAEKLERIKSYILNNVDLEPWPMYEDNEVAQGILEGKADVGSEIMRILDA